MENKLDFLERLIEINEIAFRQLVQIVYNQSSYIKQDLEDMLEARNEAVDKLYNKYPEIKRG